MGEQGRLRAWQKALLILGLVWAMLVIAPDVYRLHWPLATLGFSADNDGVIYDVYGAPATDAVVPGRAGRGLRPDDAIRLAPGACWNPQGALCRDMLSVFGGMGGLAYVGVGTTVDLPIVPKGSRDGKAVAVHLAAENDMLDSTAWLLLALDEIAGIFVIWRAFRLAWTQPGAVTTGFFLYMMWFNPGQYFALYAFLQAHPTWLLAQEVLQAMAQGAGYAGFLIFALRFPSVASEARLRWTERAAIALGAGLALLQLMSFTNVLGRPTELITRAAILGGYIVSLFALYIVWLRRKQKSPLAFQRMRWVIWGCAIGIPAFVFADSNEATSLWSRNVWSPLGLEPPEAVFEFFFLISGITAIFIGEAIRRRRVISVSFGLRRAAAASIALLLCAVVEAAAHEPIAQAFQVANVPAPLQLPASILVVLLFVLAGHRAPHLADRFMNRRFYDEAQGLEGHIDELSACESLEDVDAVIVNGPLATLNLVSGAVFRRRSDALEQIFASDNWDESKRQRFAPFAGKFLDDLERGHALRLRLKPQMRLSVEDEMTAPAIAIPILIGKTLYAVAMYGPHRTGDDLDPLEAKALQDFVHLAAATYESVRVRSLEQENEALRQELLASRSRRIKIHETEGEQPG